MHTPTYEIQMQGTIKNWHDFMFIITYKKVKHILAFWRPELIYHVYLIKIASYESNPNYAWPEDTNQMPSILCLKTLWLCSVYFNYVGMHTHVNFVSNIHIS